MIETTQAAVPASSGCPCIEQCLAALSEEFRAAVVVTVVPWGGKEG